MKLINLLELIPDENKVVVEDYDETIYEVYDGKNSIDTKYNVWNVARIDAGYYQIGITICKPYRKTK